MIKKIDVEKRIADLNVIDDTLFQKMAEDIGFCEEMLTTILNQKVKIIKVVPQNKIKNLQGRSVILDAYCKLGNGQNCNIEVQKANDDNHVKRMRYNTSCITANITEPGSKFENVPDVIGIFISKFDVFKGKKAIYHVERKIKETGEVNDNGLYEIYVNTKVDDGTDVAQLMKIFKEQEVYDFVKFPKVSKRKKYFLKGKGGKKEMCEIVEEYARQCVQEAEIEMVEKLFKNGTTYELVKSVIKTLSEDELKKIYNSVLAA